MKKKKKIIVISIVAILNTSLFAENVLGSFDHTPGRSWKDDITGINYTTFGRSSFQFKDSARNAVPILKLGAPSIKAGCSGIDFDGGFIGMLDLDMIGDQLSDASKSLGMGVIVGLLQTVPSIAKAFEDIQRIVRKFQQMIQNSCSIGKQAVANSKIGQGAKIWMESKVTEGIGAGSAYDSFMKGQETRLKHFEENIEKSPDAIAAFLGKSEANGNSKSGKNVSNVNKSIDNIVGGTAKSSTNYGVYKGEYYKSLKDGKIPQIVQIINGDNFKFSSMSDSEIAKHKLADAMFGFIYTDTEVISSKLIDGDKINVKALGEAIDNGEEHIINVKYVEPLNTVSDIKDFFTKEGKLKIVSSNLSLMIVPTDADSQGNAKGQVFYKLTREDIAKKAPLEIELSESFLDTSRKSILHAFDPKKYQDKPDFDIGVCIPNGERYLKIIKNSVEDKDKMAYIELLAKANTYYAIKQIIANARAEAIAIITPDTTGKAEKEAYLKKIKEVEKELKNSFYFNGNDIKDLNNFGAVFERLKRNGQINRAKNRL